MVWGWPKACCGTGSPEALTEDYQGSSLLPVSAATSGRRSSSSRRGDDRDFQGDDEEEGGHTDGDADGDKVLELQLAESIYDMALLAPIIASTRQRSRKSLFVYALLLLNFGLQILFACEIGSFVKTSHEELYGQLYNDGRYDGLCSEVDAEEVPNFQMSNSYGVKKYPKYWKCTPDETTLLYSWPDLDRDNDSFWTEFEADLVTNERGTFLNVTHARIAQSLYTAADFVLHYYSQHNSSEAEIIKGDAKNVQKKTREENGTSAQIIFNLKIKSDSHNKSVWDVEGSFPELFSEVMEHVKEAVVNITGQNIEPRHVRLERVEEDKPALDSLNCSIDMSQYGEAVVDEIQRLLMASTASDDLDDTVQSKMDDIRGLRHDLPEVQGLAWSGSTIRDVHRADKTKYRRVIPNWVWSSQVEPFLDFCMLQDEVLCGNAIFMRQISSYNFIERFRASSDADANAPLMLLAMPWVDMQDAVELCTVSIQEVCPKFFTSEYRSHAKQRQEFCGTTETSRKVFPRSEMNGRADKLTQTLLTSEFSMYQMYKKPKQSFLHALQFAFDPNHIPHRSILSYNFVFYTVLVLALWCTSNVEEINKVIRWLVVLSQIDVRSDGYIDDGDPENIYIKAFPSAWMKRVTLASSVSRLVLALYIWFTGTRFILLSQTRSDLVMNSLALAFLMSIDEMLLVAFVPWEHRAKISKCKPVTVPKKGTGNRVLDWGIFLISSYWLTFTLVVAYELAYLVYDYHLSPHSKAQRSVMVECLCQTEGEQCLATQVIGGFPTMDCAESHCVTRS